MDLDSRAPHERDLESSSGERGLKDTGDSSDLTRMLDRFVGQVLGKEVPQLGPELV